MMDTSLGTYIIGTILFLVGGFVVFMRPDSISVDTAQPEENQRKYKRLRFKGALLIGLGLFLIIRELITTL